MKTYSFYCYGHENLIGAHKNTIEFTKDEHLTKDGDCIIGTRSDFELSKIKEFIKENLGKPIELEIFTNGISDKITFLLNKDFSSDHEIVIRRSEFNSDRTLGFRVDKAAKDIRRDLIESIKNKNSKILVTLRA